jgi:DMSO/TMAO reductase YedYZ molybdopterin-dependent catalytic subunit
VLLLGAFAIPPLRDPLLQAGVDFGDKAANLLFRRSHLAPTYPDSAVVPFERFPYNGYDILEPDIDFDHWSLHVGGLVAKPGLYTLDQIKELPKATQNTRHVCVEGWDAIGRFGVRYPLVHSRSSDHGGVTRLG